MTSTVDPNEGVRPIRVLKVIGAKAEVKDEEGNITQEEAKGVCPRIMPSEGRVDLVFRREANLILKNRSESVEVGICHREDKHEDVFLTIGPGEVFKWDNLPLPCHLELFCGPEEEAEVAVVAVVRSFGRMVRL